MIGLNPKLLDDFVTFGAELVSSKDVDPLYPVLQYLEAPMNPEQKLWFTFLYLTYYNLPSAIQAYRLQPELGDLPPECAKLPCSTERRNLRGGKVIQHAADYVRQVRLHGSQRGFLRRGWTTNPLHNYEAFWQTAQSVWNNGRWAAFKWAEILKKVHGFNLAAPDMRMQFCSGPKTGLELLYNAPNSSVVALNGFGVDLMQKTREMGFDVADWETLETVLCNFHSLHDGRYYIGHDIDELQHAVESSALQPNEKEWIMDARAAVLPHDYLGELNGWSGVDKWGKRAYVQHRDIIRRYPAQTGVQFIGVRNA